MKHFQLIFQSLSNRLINTKVTGILKKNFTTFLDKTKNYARRRYVCQYFFILIFVCYVNTKRILYQQRISLKKKPCKSTYPDARRVPEA